MNIIKPLKFSLILIPMMCLFIKHSFAIDAKNYVPPFKVWLQIGDDTNQSAELMYSMALVESGKYTDDHHFIPWAFAIGVGIDPSIGQYEHLSLYPETFDEAKIILEGLLKSGHQNLGIGMMQINIKFNGHFVEDPIHLLDPITNINVASKVIKQCSKNKTEIQMLSCYSYGLYDSEGGYKYAQKVLDYRDRFASTYVKKHMPSGELSLSELNYFMNVTLRRDPINVSNENKKVEIIE